MEPPLLVLRTLISLGLFNIVTNQICNDGSYTLISNTRRNVKVTYDSAIDVAICDNGLNEDTWFRFSSYSGDEIVERAANDTVPMLRCGTEAPIYIRGIGSHPITDYYTITATVCANYGGNPCNWMDTIQIHRCPVQADPSYYFLYKLQSPPGCSLSYCVGDKPMCERGYYWNGLSCVNYVPPMTGFPIFSGPDTVAGEIYFNCEVQYDRQPNDSNARFLVTFLFDGQPLEYIDADDSFPPAPLQPTILHPDNSLSAQLYEYQLRGRLGREISCQAESFWDTDSGRPTNASMTSEAKYYAAFESTAESYDISLSSGSTHNITFRSTLPFTCNHCLDEVDYTTCCRYKFYMVNYTASTVHCYLLWTGGDTATVTVYVLPRATQTEDSFALYFEKYAHDLITGPSLWHDYMIPTVKMTILPQSPPYKQCHSVTDSHQLTFDGLSFDNYMSGDFYLATASNSIQLMEIQVRHEICNGGQVTCNCGVIVREGNSAIKISICEAGSWSSTVQRNPTVVRLLSQDPADASAVYVDGTGLIFSVRMPSGLRVEVDARVPWFSVYVNIPPEYHGKTNSASMCGNSNGIPSDDSMNLEQFRIPDDLNYFIQQPPCSSIYNVAAAKCGCNETYPICSNTDPTLEDISAADYPLSVNWTTGVVCSQTPAVAISSTLYVNSNAFNDFILENDILFPPYTYDPNFGVNVWFAWPTPKNKTEVQVEKYCTQRLQLSSAYADCSANVDLATVIAICASDIQIADDWLSISAYAFFFEQDCLNNIAATINSSSDSTRALLTSVSGKLCPNQCTGRGKCSKGTCTCTTGYIGADCSINQTLSPSLTGIIRGGVCDVRKRPCEVISVFGSGVPSSSALKCRFTDQNTGAHLETMGTFITAVEYSCPVPATTTHRRRRSATTRTTVLTTRKVSIMIDGVLYSNMVDFVVFDSVCMECTSSDTCRQTENSCLISDECFADMAFNPGDSGLRCIPSVSRNSWTNVTDNAEQKTQGFGITLSSEDLKLILIDPFGSLVPFSDALNQYCSKNAAACCSSIGMETRASAVTYASPGLLTYASGYPVINTNDASLKIIVKIDRAKLEAECSQTQTQGSNIVYADPKLIYDAVNSEKSEIEKALSITITSAWSSTALPSATRRTDASLNHNLNGI